MLVGDVVVRFTVADGGHQARLAIVVRERPDPGQTAQRRAAAIGRDHQGRLERPPVLKADFGMRRTHFEIGDRSRLEDCDRRTNAGKQCRSAGPVGHHMRKSFARCRGAGEIEKDRTRHIAGSRIGDLHGRDRIGRIGHARPHPDGFEKISHTRGNGRGAQILGHRQLPPVEQSQTYAGNKAGQRYGEREPHRPTPYDQNVQCLRLRAVSHAASSFSIGSTMRSVSSGGKGADAASRTRRSGAHKSRNRSTAAPSVAHDLSTKDCGRIAARVG